MHILTTQAQVTASGIFPWSDWLPTGIPVNETRSQQSARAACTKPAWQLNHVNPAYSLKRHIMKLMIIKNDDSKNNDNNNKYGTVI